MPFLTLGQAAKECGKQKSTILDAIRAGRLSASKDDKNQWQIDPSELFRVYQAQHHTDHITERDTTSAEHNTTPAQLAKLLENEQRERERERSMLKEQIELLKDQVDRERQQADHWRNQATMLLTHQPEPPKTGQPTGSRLYEKLFGRK
jgi:hypothetical protein